MLDGSVRIAPSVLSANFACLGDELASVATADLIHYDVMDGHFVPNLSFGTGILRQVKRATDLPLDVHLMVDNPDATVPWYLEAGADIVTFHWEAATHATRIVQQIHAAGAKAGVALNPATPVSSLECLVDDVDLVLVMSVNPGFGGQSYIEGTDAKLRALSALCASHGVSPLVEVDGGVSTKTAERIVRAGATVLVAGSAVFNTDDRAAAIVGIRAAGERGLGRQA